MVKSNAAPLVSSTSSKSLIPVMVLVAGIVVALSLLLQPTVEDKKEIVTCRKKTTHVKKKNKQTPLAIGYNEPFLPHKKTSVFATGSYIYWQPSQDNFFVGQVFSQANISNANINTNFSRKTKNFRADYQSGFKVGLGAQFPQDNWSLYAEYTRLHSHMHTTVAPTPPNFAQSSWVPVVNSLFQSATLLNSMMSNSWKFQFDLLDLNLLRACFVGKNLIFSPFITGRGVWIRQSLAATESFVTSLTNFSAEAEFKQHSVQVGPRVGTDIHWLLGGGVRFSGKVGAALLYNRNHSHQTVPFLIPIGVRPDSPDHYTTTYGAFCPNLDLGVGFAWESKKNFGISASYDILTFFNQNNLGQFHILDDFGQSNSPNATPFGLQSQNNLTMHGLTVTMSYAF